MSLCIIGSDSLDQLQEIAENHFSDIKNLNCTVTDYQHEIIFDRVRGLNRIFKI